MIANLKTTFLIMVAAFITTQSMASSHFRQIADDYSIDPFIFEAGYPVAYKFDEQPVRGIIFLSAEAEYLNKLDNRTYVGPPTEENAAVIANFSARPEGEVLYYIVVDSAVALNEMTPFLEKLGNDEPLIQVRFVDGEGKYIPMTWYNQGFYMNKGLALSCFPSLRHELLLNQPGDVMLEWELVKMNDVRSFFEEHYLHNLDGVDDCLDCPMKKALDVGYYINRISKLEELLMDRKGDVALEEELERVKRRSELAVRFGYVSEVSKGYWISIRTQRNAPLKSFFELMGAIQAGVLRARHKCAVQKWGRGYFDLFFKKEYDFLEWLDLGIPDRIVLLFNNRDAGVSNLPPVIEGEY